MEHLVGMREHKRSRGRSQEKFSGESTRWMDVGRVKQSDEGWRCVKGHYCQCVSLNIKYRRWLGIGRVNVSDEGSRWKVMVANTMD